MSHWITNQGLTGEDPVRMGTSNSLICPLRVFPTRTQPVFVAGTNDAFWRILCTALGKQDWLADKRFATNPDRVANRAILEPMIEEYFLQHTADELLDKLIPAGMACSAAYKISEAMASPHAQARAACSRSTIPGIGPGEVGQQPHQALRRAGHDAAEVADGGRAHGRDHARGRIQRRRDRRLARRQGRRHPVRSGHEDHLFGQARPARSADLLRARRQAAQRRAAPNAPSACWPPSRAPAMRSWRPRRMAPRRPRASTRPNISTS